MAVTVTAPIDVLHGTDGAVNSAGQIVLDIFGNLMQIVLNGAYSGFMILLSFVQTNLLWIIVIGVIYFGWKKLRQRNIS